mmetsp:Transcript_26607/g.48226  ORF Transcript_26607/g.48226 Transcript_26607/m.48226 type:complete len:300 (-) Transcript_26607:347-1246(-)
MQDSNNSEVEQWVQWCTEIHDSIGKRAEIYVQTLGCSLHGHVAPPTHAGYFMVEFEVDGVQYRKQVPKPSIKVLQVERPRADDFLQAVHYGAFSVAGTAEEVCPRHCAQGDALPKDALTWKPDSELLWWGMSAKWAGYLQSMVTDGEQCKIQDLMACRDSNGARTKLSQYLDNNLGAHTPGGQNFPFLIFASTLAEILTTEGKFNTHEQTWPFACESREYGDSIADVLNGKKHTWLRELLDKPILCHVGKKNDKIGAFSRYQKDESGKWIDVGDFHPNAAWGVPSHDGLLIKDKHKPID